MERDSVSGNIFFKCLLNELTVALMNILVINFGPAFAEMAGSNHVSLHFSPPVLFFPLCDLPNCQIGASQISIEGRNSITWQTQEGNGCPEVTGVLASS